MRIRRLPPDYSVLPETEFKICALSAVRRSDFLFLRNHAVHDRSKRKHRSGTGGRFRLLPDSEGHCFRKLHRQMELYSRAPAFLSPVPVYPESPDTAGILSAVPAVQLFYRDAVRPLHGLPDHPETLRRHSGAVRNAALARHDISLPPPLLLGRQPGPLCTICL